MGFQRFLPFIFLSLFLISGWGCKATTTSTSKAKATATPVPTITSGGTIHISGTLTYDFIPATTAKLNYLAVTQKPMRNVYLELLNAANDAVISSMSTSDLGAYDFTISAAGSVKLRIYAEMKSPSVIIQDNTNGNAAYALVTPAYSITTSTVKDIRAVSGWSGSNGAGSYTATRVAAPFAILDSIYTITKKIQTARPAVTYPQLKVNWSINNIPTSGTISLGQIGTSHYNSSTNQLYILGKADVDTDEYDNHVIVHEWGHFFEANLSRSDSPGGSHGFGEVKEMSLAFGEGWGNALSAMAFDPDVYYSDTSGAKQQSGFQMSLESTTDTNKGWFSEVSIEEILYDIYDSTNEAGDAISQGIGPIIDVLMGYQKTTPAATSIFTFIYGLKTADATLSANLDTLLATKSIASITDPYGTGETNNGGWADNLPIYQTITLGGAAVPLSLYGNFGNDSFYGLYNTAYNNKYLKFVASSSTTRLTVSSTDTFEIDVYKNGVNVSSNTQLRSSAAAFGPFSYNIATTPGTEYTVQLLSDEGAIFADAIISLTVTGTAL